MFEDLEQKNQKNTGDAGEPSEKTVEDMFASVDGDRGEKPSPSPQESPSPQAKTEPDKEPAKEATPKAAVGPGPNSGSFLGVLAPDNFIKFMVYVIILLIIVIFVSYLISGFYTIKYV
jgi:hypothetical protein